MRAAARLARCTGPAAALLLLLCAARAGTARDVRPPALAGAWYPASRAEIVAEVQRLLRATGDAPRPAAKPRALVVPHAGWAYSGHAAAAAFRALRGHAYRRVIVLAPSHRASFDGFAVDRRAAYRTPLGDVPACSAEAAALASGAAAADAPRAGDREHAIEIELPFLQQVLAPGFCLVPLLAGATSAAQERALAAQLAGLDDGQTLFVVSTDFTHYGARFDHQPHGALDRAVAARVRETDARALQLAMHDPAGFRALVETTGATICGRAGLGVLAEFAPARPLGATVVAHYASNDVPGVPPDGHLVDYAAAVLAPGAPASGSPLGAPAAAVPVGIDAPALDAAQGTQLVRVARAALRTELLGTADLGTALAALPDGGPWERLQAVFVTLNRTRPDEIAREGRLRGCIGQLEPAYPLAGAVVRAAVAAALSDPRFPPVAAAELPRLAVEVTALSAPRPVGSWREIRLGTHGIILAKQGRRAVFLPQVAPEQGWTLEQALDQLALKAGLPRDAWREGAQFLVFTGQVFHEAAPSNRTGD